MELSADVKRDMFWTMLLSRRLDERAWALHRQGRIAFHQNAELDGLRRVFRGSDRLLHNRRRRLYQHFDTPGTGSEVGRSRLRHPRSREVRRIGGIELREGVSADPQRDAVHEQSLEGVVLVQVHPAIQEQAAAPVVDIVGGLERAVRRHDDGHRLRLRSRARRRSAAPSPAPLHCSHLFLSPASCGECDR